MKAARWQKGATVVEFALVLLTFLMFLLAILDFSRLLFVWNAAAEATRAGARFAAVCDDTDRKDAVLAKMKMILPEIVDISLQWEPAGCDNITCEGVTVRVTDLDFQWISPLVGATVPNFALPTYQTYLPREIMRRDPNSDLICT